MFDPGTPILLATFDEWGDPIAARPGHVVTVSRASAEIVVELEDGETVSVDDPDALTVR